MMRIDGAWWPRTEPGASEADQIADIRAQVHEWAEAEPNIVGYTLLRVHRPYPERRHWYETEIEARMREADVQPTLGLA